MVKAVEGRFRAENATDLLSHRLHPTTPNFPMNSTNPDLSFSVPLVYLKMEHQIIQVPIIFRE